MERSISEKEREMIINFGAFGYNIPTMANILGWEVSVVKDQYLELTSDFYRLYMEGRDKARYVIDLKLFELAQAGDLKALQELEKRNKIK